MRREPLNILLVDDSDADAQLIERALRERGLDHALMVVNDGQAALDYLNRSTDPGFPARDKADLILLDLNLPGMDGVQVLTAIKTDPCLRQIPVVVLTTSGLDEDVRRSYQAGASTFIRKPDEYPRYGELVTTLHAYWGLTAQFPPRGRLN
jgi:CheY-like chemotaxis protein